MNGILPRLAITILALISGAAFGSMPETSERAVPAGTTSIQRRPSASQDFERGNRQFAHHAVRETAARKTPNPAEGSRSRMATNVDEAHPQTAGDRSPAGLLGLIALGASGALVQPRRPRH